MMRSRGGEAAGIELSSIRVSGKPASVSDWIKQAKTRERQRAVRLFYLEERERSPDVEKSRTCPSMTRLE